MELHMATLVKWLKDKIGSQKSRDTAKMARDRDNVGLQLVQMFSHQPSAFVSEFPKETKTLDKKCVGVVMGYLKNHDPDVQMIFGSFGAMAQLMPRLRTLPGDIDVQLTLGKNDAIAFTNKLFLELKKFDDSLRINTSNPLIIETNKNGSWERAVDFHASDEPPEDIMSPLASLSMGNKNREHFRAKDALGFYRSQMTLFESARKLKSKDQETLSRAERLIDRFEELWGDEIDFEKLEVRQKP